MAGADGSGRSVVAHDAPATGREPTLELYFFDKLRPVMDAALAAPRPDTWPLVVLHLDFKTNERAHHRAIWDLLGRHERWLTTAPRVAGDAHAAADARAAARADRERRRPVARVLMTRCRSVADCGSSAPCHPRFSRARRTATRSSTPRSTRSPQTLIPSGTTNYRRWTNFSWAVVERGGQARAADWTTADDRRLRSIVSTGARARALGAVLHAERPRPGRRAGLDGELQLRIARGGPAAMARRGRRRRRFHRDGSVRRAGAADRIFPAASPSRARSG